MWIVLQFMVHMLSPCMCILIIVIYTFIFVHFYSVATMDVCVRNFLDATSKQLMYSISQDWSTTICTVFCVYACVAYIVPLMSLH